MGSNAWLTAWVNNNFFLKKNTFLFQFIMSLQRGSFNWLWKRIIKFRLLLHKRECWAPPLSPESCSIGNLAWFCFYGWQKIFFSPLLSRKIYSIRQSPSINFPRKWATKTLNCIIRKTQIEIEMRWGMEHKS